MKVFIEEKKRGFKKRERPGLLVQGARQQVVLLRDYKYM